MPPIRMTAVTGQRVIQVSRPPAVFVVHHCLAVLMTDETGEDLIAARRVTGRAGDAVWAGRNREAMRERSLCPRRVGGAMTAVAGGREPRRGVIRGRGPVIQRPVTADAIP